MRRGWKRLTERAGNLAFDDKEVGEALARTLQADCRIELPKAVVADLRNILGDPTRGLFDDAPTERLEALRADTAGLPLASTLLDSVFRVVDQGDRGDEALATATSETLQERAASGRRQLVEHCLRTSSPQNAKCVSNRIDDAIAAADMKTIARRCLGLDDDPAPRTPVRKTGIDDGVSLS